MKKKLFITILIVLIIGVSGWLFIQKSSINKNKGTDINLTAIVKKEILKETVEVSGNIQPVKARELKFKYEETISVINVAVGDSVTKGDILAELDKSDVELNIAQKVYAIEQERRTGSQRKVELMEMELKQLNGGMEKRNIIAPFNGIITHVRLKVGDSSSISDSFITLINRKTLISKVNIDELDIPVVVLGQKVVLKFDALPNKEYSGYISKLSLVGKLTEKGIAVREAELTIENPPSEIFTPYSFSSQIIIKEEVEVLIVNKETIIHKSDKTFVKLAKSKLEDTEVLIKSYKHGAVIVLSGLSEGDEVLLQKQINLNNDEMVLF